MASETGKRLFFGDDFLDDDLDSDEDDEGGVQPTEPPSLESIAAAALAAASATVAPSITSSVTEQLIADSVKAVLEKNRIKASETSSMAKLDTPLGHVWPTETPTPVSASTAYVNTEGETVF